MSTADAISPDSDRPWGDAGAWPVAPGVHRIPLPLPNDGLRAVNVYALETVEPDGARSLTLVDGGWAIQEADDALRSALATLGAGVEDVRRFLVTHVHRDHYTQAVALRRATGAEVVLGRGEETSLALAGDPDGGVREVMAAHLSDAGSVEDARRLRDLPDEGDLDIWEAPDTWLDGDVRLEVGERAVDAVHTPGHTKGHYVFADAAAGLLLAGDHVLPTITPSIGFEPDTQRAALADFLGSLAKVRALPDLRLLPAHGPVTGSAHARVDELLEHHETRLALSRAPLDAAGAEGLTARDVAAHLPWTRHEHAFATLDPFNAALAVMETRAHLEVLVARGEATVRRAPAPTTGPGTDRVTGEPARYTLA
ncbi:MBL fold metallo-hydrolase [Nocardioides sp. CPCC 205120]|uniref:MBL fold metallo-hydrolase n=1 Tax=Nocardioides sp. CPCC 205120 TaxID=3406462 RepID=UPI003B50C0FE